MTSHNVTELHICLIFVQRLVLQVQIDLALLPCCCFWCLLRRTWADQSDPTGSLKRQELKQSMWDRGGIQSRSTGRYEWTNVFLSIKACKPILVVTQKKMSTFRNIEIKCTHSLTYTQNPRFWTNLTERLFCEHPMHFVRLVVTGWNWCGKMLEAMFM